MVHLTIISKQSGCGEILTNCIKVDYWDIHALADAIYSICHNESLFDYLSEEGKKGSRPDYLGESGSPHQRSLSQDPWVEVI